MIILDEKLKKLEKEVINDLFKNNLTRGEVMDKHGITRREYKKILKHALKSGGITSRQNKKRISRAMRCRLKIDKETVKRITYDVFKNGLTRPEICEKYDISKSTFGRAMELSVNYGFVSGKKLKEYRDSAHIRGNRKKIQNLGKKALEEIILQQGAIPEGDTGLLVEKLGREESYRRCEEGKLRWMTSNMGIVRLNASKGGKETQKRYGEKVKKNLKGNRYSKKKIYYEEVEFSSEGERFTGLLLAELGFIPEIIVGENFQRPINGKKRVDFYINDNLIVEYHPLVKEHQGIETLTDEEYMGQRAEQFNGVFNGVVVNITKTTASEYYEKLGLGSKMDFSKFLEIYHFVEKKIEEHDQKTAELYAFFGEKTAANKR